MLDGPSTRVGNRTVAQACDLQVVNHVFLQGLGNSAAAPAAGPSVLQTTVNGQVVCLLKPIPGEISWLSGSHWPHTRQIRDVSQNVN